MTTLYLASSQINIGYEPVDIHWTFKRPNLSIEYKKLIKDFDQEVAKTGENLEELLRLVPTCYDDFYSFECLLEQGEQFHGLYQAIFLASELLTEQDVEFLQEYLGEVDLDTQFKLKVSPVNVPFETGKQDFNPVISHLLSKIVLKNHISYGFHDEIEPFMVGYFNTPWFDYGGLTRADLLVERYPYSREEGCYL